MESTKQKSQNSSKISTSTKSYEKDNSENAYFLNIIFCIDGLMLKPKN